MVQTASLRPAQSQTCSLDHRPNTYEAEKGTGDHARRSAAETEAHAGGEGGLASLRTTTRSPEDG